MFSWLFPQQNTLNFESKLFDEKHFYKQLISDITQAREEIIIESPFLNSSRVTQLLPHLLKAIRHGIKVVIITRAQYFYAKEEMENIEDLICKLEECGVRVILTINSDHRKLAFIDRKILWEGSLNILSHATSREIMRRISSPQHVIEMLHFTSLCKLL